MLQDYPRLELVIVDRGRILIGALLILALIGFGGAVWLSSNPPTTDVPRTVYSETINTETSDSVVLTNDTILYENDTRLSDMPAYMRSWSDELDLTVTTRMPDSRTATVNHTLVAVYRATANDGTLYEERKTLHTSSSKVTDGTAQSTVTLNVSELPKPKNRIEEEFGGVATVTMDLTLLVRYETEAYDGTFTGSVPLSIEGDSFTIGSFSDSRTHTAETTETITRNRPRSQYLLTAGSGLISLLAATVLGAIYYRKLDQGRAVDRNATIDRLHHQRYEDWISVGTITRDLPKDALAVNTLEDLVDVAIDTDRRVIFDPTAGKYVVFDGEQVYTYTPSQKVATRMAGKFDVREE